MTISITPPDFYCPVIADTRNCDLFSICLAQYVSDDVKFRLKPAMEVRFAIETRVLLRICFISCMLRGNTARDSLVLRRWLIDVPKAGVNKDVSYYIARQNWIMILCNPNVMSQLPQCGVTQCQSHNMSMSQFGGQVCYSKYYDTYRIFAIASILNQFLFPEKQFSTCIQINYLLRYLLLILINIFISSKNQHVVIIIITS